MSNREIDRAALGKFEDDFVEVAAAEGVESADNDAGEVDDGRSDGEE